MKKITLFLIFCLSLTSSLLTAQNDTASLRTTIIEEYESGNTYTALEKIEEYLKLESKNWEILDIKTLCEMENGDEKNAFLSAEKTANANTEKAVELWTKYGFIYFQRYKEYQTALKYYDRALKISDKDWRTLAGVGLTYASTEDYKKGAEFLKKAITNAKAEDAKNLNAVYGYCLHKNGKSEEGLKSVSQYVNDLPQQNDGYAIRAEILKDLQRYEESLQDIDKIVSFSPDNADIRSERALIYDQMGNKEMAQSEIIAARKMGSNMAFDSIAAKYAQPYELKIQAGNTLFYKVNYFGDEYFFKFKIKELVEGKIVIDYEVTNDPDDYGTINQLSKSLQSARTIRSYYGGETGANITLSDSTSAVWVSKLVYNELVNKKATAVDIVENGVFNTFNLEKETNFVFLKEDKNLLRLPTLVANYKDAENGYSFWVYKNVNLPIILKMNVGWTMELDRIE